MSGSSRKIANQNNLWARGFGVYWTVIFSVIGEITNVLWEIREASLHLVYSTILSPDRDFSK